MKAALFVLTVFAAAPAGAAEEDAFCRDLEKVMAAASDDFLSVVHWERMGGKRVSSWRDHQRHPGSRTGLYGGLPLRPLEEAPKVRYFFATDGDRGFPAGTATFEAGMQIEEPLLERKIARDRYETAVRLTKRCLPTWTRSAMTPEAFHPLSGNPPESLVEGVVFYKEGEKVHLEARFTQRRPVDFIGSLFVVKLGDGAPRPSAIYGKAPASAASAPSAAPARASPYGSEPSFCTALDTALKAAKGGFASIRGARHEERFPAGFEWYEATVAFPGATGAKLHQGAKGGGLELAVRFLETPDRTAADKAFAELSAAVGACKKPCGTLVKSKHSNSALDAEAWIPFGGNAVCPAKLTLDVTRKAIPDVNKRNAELHLVTVGVRVRP
jgi:hypothetical protein